MHPTPTTRRAGRTLGLLAALAAGAAIAGSAPAAAAPAAACKAGVGTFAGAPARTFCGPAHARVTAGGRASAFPQGECTRSGTGLVVNLGTVVLGNVKKAKPAYLGLSLGSYAGQPAARRDGRYAAGVLALVVGGRSLAMRSDGLRVTLAGNRSRGTFAAKLLAGGSLAGTFSC